MGFPVKVPEEIYARIKERAEREGISYQEALVRLIAEPQAALEEARREREELRAQVAELAQRVVALEGATAKAETSLKAMDKKITELAQKKPELPPHEHPQYAHAEALQKLSQSVREWGQKLTDLEETVDSILGEMGALQENIADFPTWVGRVQNLENNYTAFVNAFQSWVPTWKKIDENEQKFASASDRLHSLSRAFSTHASREKEHLEKLQEILEEFEERLAAVEALSHRHLGQPVKGPKGRR